MSRISPAIKTEFTQETEYQSINLWANTLLRLEKELTGRRKEISNKDYPFLKQIGQGFYYANTYNSILVKEIEAKITSVGSEASCPLGGIASHIRFFNNLVASKIKNFFFRETPNSSLNSPFLQLDLEIYRSASALPTLLKEYRRYESALKVNVSKYMYLLDLFYSFIYDSATGKGVFLSFTYDSAAFANLSSLILERLNNVTSESDLRSFLSLLHLFALRSAHNSLDNIPNVSPSDIYTTFVNSFTSSTDALIEPLTWHFSNIGWKLDGMLQDDDEYLFEIDKASHDAILITKVKDFAHKYFSSCAAMYRSNTIDYLSLFNIENDFIQFVLTDILQEKPLYDVRNTFQRLDRYVAEIGLPCVTLTSLENDINGLSAFTQSSKKQDRNERLFKGLAELRGNNEAGFKLENIIEKLNSDQILNLLSLYTSLFRKDIVNSHATEFVGFYKSGVFLAHVTNLFLRLNKPVWLFKTYPYVATHPIHKDQVPTFDSIIIFDESIKTGFTYSLYESYVVRNLPNTPISTSVYSLFNFHYYEKLQFLNPTGLYSLIDLNDKLIPTNVMDISSLFLQTDVKKLQLPPLDEHELPHILRCMYSTNSHPRLDLTFLLSSTPIVSWIAIKFAKQIMSFLKASNRKTVSLFCPSGDAEILGLMTGFFLRVKDIQVTYTANNPRVATEGLLTVALDTFVETEYTLGRKWALIHHRPFRKENVAASLSDIDLVLAIAGRIKRPNVKYLLNLDEEVERFDGLCLADEPKETNQNQ